MRILDRYIAIKFINVLIFAIIAFIILFMVVDGIDHLDKFIDRDMPSIMILKYYYYYLPYIIILCMPVAMLLASLFSIGQLAKYNELTAMKASGVSLYRIVAPILLIALVVSIGIIYFGELVLPRATSNKMMIEQTYLESGHLIRHDKLNINIRDKDNRRISIKYYNANIKRGRDVNILEFDDTNLIRRIDAKFIQWEDHRWVLLDGYERKNFQERGEDTRYFTRWPTDSLSFLPEDVEKVQKQPEEMSYAELKEFIAEVERNGGDRDRWMVDLYMKFSFPFANFIIVLFGAPLSASKRRGGAAMGFGISLVICFLYFGLVKTGQTMGHNGTFSPFIGAWIANFVFATAGIITLIKTRK